MSCELKLLQANFPACKHSCSVQTMIGMEKLKTYLALAGTRQAALAAAIGVSRGYMSQLVGGSKQPSLSLAFKIAQATGGAVPVTAWSMPIASVQANEEDAA